MYSIGQSVKFKREKNNLTQEELARRSKVLLIDLQEIESGDIHPDRDTYGRLLDGCEQQAA